MERGLEKILRRRRKTSLPRPCPVSLRDVVRTERRAPGHRAHLAVDGKRLLLLELSRGPVGLRSEDAIPLPEGPPTVTHALLVGPDEVTVARDPRAAMRLLAKDHPGREIRVPARVDRLGRLRRWRRGSGDGVEREPDEASDGRIQPPGMVCHLAGV